jgi:NAD(P)-dependent dehydrogenase (short-subunit alcohol dehydrogenase family)
MKSIRNKKALVTGAASGIGRSIALALAREGADVYLLDVDAAGLDSAVAEASQCNVTAIGALCDLTQPVQIAEAISEMLNRWQHIDILVNNAGVAYYGPTHCMTAAQWDWVMKINLLAPIQITHELLPVLLERPEAHILNVCSISSLVAAGRSAAYHTSKFGLLGLTEALRAEYGRRGLGVSALCPGPVLTNLYKSCASAKRDKAVPQPPEWLCCSLESVSRAAIRCIYRKKQLKVVGVIAQMLILTKRLAPWLLDLMNHASRKRKKPALAEVPAARRAA